MRRYALLGWAVWKVGKRVAKRRAKSALPGTGESTSLRVAPLAVVLAGAAGVAWYLWNRRDDGGNGFG